MRFVPINCVREGMVLGKTLLGSSGEMLLNCGIPIRAGYIEKLQELGYTGVYIVDDLSQDIEARGLITDSLRQKTVKTIRKTFISFQNGHECEDMDDIKNQVDSIVDEILGSKDTIVNVMDLKVFDDYTYYHSVNVAVLSIVVGIALGLDRNRLSQLGYGAILHDIGKVFIPRDLLNKPGRLSGDEFNVIKKHSRLGYQYIREKFEIPISSYIGILQHHEKVDGTGYPMQIKDSQISLFGKIIAVCDVYDALTSNRPYRKALSPSEAIEYIMGGGGVFFDPHIVNCFVQRIAPYPTGTCVRLSNNMVGIVVENYSDCCMRPRVKIIRHGDQEVKPFYLNLKSDADTLGITVIGMEDEIFVEQTA